MVAGPLQARQAPPTCAYRSDIGGTSMADNPTSTTSAGKCPVMHTPVGVRSNRDWWPNQLNVNILHQNSSLSNPMGEAFDYAKEFKSLDLNAVIKDLHALMTDWEGKGRRYR